MLAGRRRFGRILIGIDSETGDLAALIMWPHHIALHATRMLSGRIRELLHDVRETIFITAARTSNGETDVGHGRNLQ
jgi:hypothetical protein